MFGFSKSSFYEKWDFLNVIFKHKMQILPQCDCLLFCVYSFLSETTFLIVLKIWNKLNPNSSQFVKNGLTSFKMSCANCKFIVTFRLLLPFFSVSSAGQGQQKWWSKSSIFFWPPRSSSSKISTWHSLSWVGIKKKSY